VEWVRWIGARDDKLNRDVAGFVIDWGIEMRNLSTVDSYENTNQNR
jgi:hypothetical protein